MFNVYETTNLILKDVDYSVFNYKLSEEIDFSKLNLSCIPDVDFSKIKFNIDCLYDNLIEFQEAVLRSRLSSEKRDFCLNKINTIASLVDACKNYTIKVYNEKQYYDYVYSLSKSLKDLSLSAPLSVKDKVSSYYSTLKEDIDALHDNVYNRDYIFSHLTKTILNESEKYRENKIKESLSVKGFTSKDLECCNSTFSSEFFRAACWYASDRFGTGAADMVRAVFYSYKSKNNRPELEWTFSDRVDPIIECARYLGVKEFSFEGDCSSCLSNLFVLTKLGLSFRIEEVTTNTTRGTRTRPVVIVTL